MQIKAILNPAVEFSCETFRLEHSGKLAVVTRNQDGQTYVGSIIYSTQGKVINFKHHEVWTSASNLTCRLLGPNESVTLSN
jgi:hypothetical protein